MFGNNGQKTQSFAVPAGAGDYAPEVLYFKSADQNTIPKRSGEMDKVSFYQLDITALPATADIEVDLLAPGADPSVGASWTNHKTYSATGVQTVQVLVDRAVRVRAVSGGTAGTATAATSWSGTGTGLARNILELGGGSVIVNADGTVSLVGDTDITGTLDATGLITATAGVKLGTTVTLTSTVANRLDLASGDSFNIVSGDLTVGGDAEISNGSGLRIGHTAFLTTASPGVSSGAMITHKHQILGTAATDSAASIVRTQASAGGPGLTLAKGRGASLGSFGIVLDSDTLGSVAFAADDGVNLGTISARITAKVNDAAPAASSIGGQLIFEVAKGLAADDITEALRIDADLSATFAGDHLVAGNHGFYGQGATAKPTGVAVSAAGIHAALVTLNLIAA